MFTVDGFILVNQVWTAEISFNTTNTISNTYEYELSHKYIKFKSLDSYLFYERSLRGWNVSLPKMDNKIDNFDSSFGNRKESRSFGPFTYNRHWTEHIAIEMPIMWRLLHIFGWHPKLNEAPVVDCSMLSSAIQGWTRGGDQWFGL